MRSEFDDPPASARARWLGAALVAGAILVVSAAPIPGSVPEEGGGIPTSVLFHFSGYAALAAAVAIALRSRRLRSEAEAIGGAFVGASGYGVLMELLQLVLPYRTFSYLDMAINAAGALFAVVVLVPFVVPVLHRRSE